MQVNPDFFRFHDTLPNDMVYIVIDTESFDVIKVCHSYELAKSYLSPSRVIKGPIVISDFKQPQPIPRNDDYYPRVDPNIIYYPEFHSPIVTPFLGTPSISSTIPKIFPYPHPTNDTFKKN